MSDLRMEKVHLAAPNIFELISWEDVLLPNLAADLSLKDLFTLRCCSRTTKNFAELALEQREEVVCMGNKSRNMNLTFAVVASCCRRLKSLKLVCCGWLTDELLLPVLIKNTRLRVIILDVCGIQPAGLTPLVLQYINECKDLNRLELTNCQWLNDGGMDALSLNNLEILDLSYCTVIGEQCLITLVQKLNKVFKLSLPYVTSVTDQVLTEISIHCRALQLINLIGCASITDHGVQALAGNCAQLQSALVNFCPLVTSRALGLLRSRVTLNRVSVSFYLHLGAPEMHQRRRSGPRRGT